MRGGCARPVFSDKCFAPKTQTICGGSLEVRRKILTWDSDGDRLAEHLDQDALPVLACHPGVDHLAIFQRALQDGQLFADAEPRRRRELDQTVALLRTPELDHVARQEVRNRVV